MKIIHTCLFIHMTVIKNPFYFCGGARGARGVMVIVVGIGHGDTSSNRGRD